jgi:hypothetical protein
MSTAPSQRVGIPSLLSYNPQIGLPCRILSASWALANMDALSEGCARRLTERFVVIDFAAQTFGSCSPIRLGDHAEDGPGIPGGN